MSDNTQNPGGYGFSEETVNEASYKFGLNHGVTNLTKFEWTPNGGKDGAEQEAIDIIFNVNGREVSYRRFPVQKAYYKENPEDQNSAQLETEDPNHPAFKEAQAELSAVLVHIVGCFVPKEDIKAALQTPIRSFKDYCKVLQGLLPSDYSTKPLDIFFNWQWQIKGDNNRTYLELPKKMKHGRWLSASVVPAGGEWEEQRKQNASSNEAALRYVDAEGNVHPFWRNGWFMESAFASMQKEAEPAGAAGVNTGSSGSGW